MRHIGKRGNSTRIGVGGAMLVTIALFCLMLVPGLALALVEGGPVATPKALAPVNTAAPTLTGTPALGQTLTCSQGTWSNSPTSFSYAWLRNGAPIAGQTAGTYVVQVADEGHTISCQVTAGNGGGNYTIGGLSSGSYKVYFYAGYLEDAGNYLPQYFNGKNAFTEADALTVTAPNATANVNAELHPGGEISGTVTSAVGKAPLSGVEACAYEASKHGYYGCGDTNSAGGYAVTGLPTGTYDVEFSSNAGSSNYLETEVANVVVTAGGATAVANAELQAGGEISGTITSAVGKAPLANMFACAEVGDAGFFGDCATTNASGDYTIGGLVSDSYRVEFYRGYEGGNYLTQYYNDKEQSSEAELVPVTVEKTTSNINAEMHPGGQISGMVTSAATKAPVAGIEVCANEQGGSSSYGSCASTNSAGEYTVMALPTGKNYKVQFSAGYESADNYASQYYDDKEKESEAGPVSVTAGGTTSNINAEMHPGGEIGGKVIDAATKAPLAEIDVCAEGEIAYNCAVTNTAGEYKIDGLSTTSYAVEFYTNASVNYLTQYYNGKTLYSESELVPVTAGSLTANIDAEMHPGAEIGGRVTDANTHTGIVNAVVCAEETGKGDGFGCASTTAATASLTKASNSVSVPSGNFTQAKPPKFDSKTDDIDFFFTFPTAGTLKWSLFFRNADVGFADSLGISLSANEPALAEAARHKGKAKSKKCKKTQTKHRGRCVATLVQFASGLQNVPAGTVEVKVHADSKAIKALKSGHTLHVSGTFTFQSALGGPPVAHTVSTVVHLSKKAAKAKKHRKGKKR